MDNFDVRENGTDYELSLKDLFRTLRQGLVIIVVTSLVFAAAAFGYFSLFVPKTYTTEVKFYVETTKQTQDINTLAYASRLINTYIDLLETNNFNEQLSDSLDNRYSPSQLNARVKFVMAEEGGTAVFRATVAAPGSADAKIIADSVAELVPEFLSDIKSDNANIKSVDDPVVPAAPSSPNIPRNTLMALAAGFVLSLIYVFVREALDNRIKYSDDKNELEGIPVLAAVPDFSGTDRFAGKADEKSDQESKSSAKEVK